MSADSLAARSAYVVNLAVSLVVTKNQDWILDQYESNVFDLGLN
jgi:hypothetical protein